MLPDGTPCQVPVGTVCHRNHCLPLRDWRPLMLQLKLLQRWRNVFNLIVTNSEAVKHHLTVEGIEPVEVVWNGVPIRSPRPHLSSPPTVAFAGRLVWEKGADILVRAFAKVIAQIPNARLLLAGEGLEWEHLNKLIVDLRLSLSIQMTGHLTRLEMESRFAKAWVQAVPSRWTEPFGIVAAEAMMRGTAVVASDSGGLTEIVQDGQTGLLVPTDDTDALAEALVCLLRNRELAERMGRAGRSVALAHYSEETFVDRFIQIYQTL